MAEINCSTLEHAGLWSCERCCPHCHSNEREIVVPVVGRLDQPLSTLRICCRAATDLKIGTPAFSALMDDPAPPL
jgi:hypothetical protein